MDPNDELFCYKFIDEFDDTLYRKMIDERIEISCEITDIEIVHENPA